MPTPRKYEDAATKRAAYRIRKEKERLVLGAAILDLAQAVRQARTHGPVQVATRDGPGSPNTHPGCAVIIGFSVTEPLDAMAPLR